MSKLAVISDIHANIIALDTILNDIALNGIDEVICLGDLVLKYYHPKEVIDSMINNNIKVIKGNCDYAVTKNYDYKWVRSNIGIDRIDYLDNLPCFYKNNIFGLPSSFFHSAPDIKTLDAMFNPLFIDNYNTKYFDKLIMDYKKMFLDDVQIVFTGHTHQPYIAMEVNDELIIQSNDLIVPDNTRVIVNPGSVGEVSYMFKNNDGIYDSRPDDYISYAIIDNIDNRIHIHIKKISYTDKLLQVYIDGINGQNNGDYPYSPIDNSNRLISIQKQFEKQNKVLPNDLPKLKSKELVKKICK